MKANVCRGCKKNLTIPRQKFAWYTARGYSPKDAAAAVLYLPTLTDRAPEIRTCCVVALETDFDADKELVDRRRARAEEKYRSEEEIKKVTGRKPEREIVRVFAANENLTLGGKFILRDSDDPNISSLVENIESRQVRNLETGELEWTKKTVGSTGFPITDIRQVPRKIMDNEGWDRDSTLLALWTQNKKIIPVLHVGNETAPGNLWLYTSVYNNGQQQNVYTPFDAGKIDKTLLGADIIGYVEGVQESINGIIVVVDVITLRKLDPKDVIA